MPNNAASAKATWPKVWRLLLFAASSVYFANAVFVVIVLRRPEWHSHLLKIMYRGWVVFVAQDVGSTSRGFISGALETGLGITMVAAMTGYLFGLRELKKHLMETALIALFAFATVTLVVYGSQFAWEIITLTYEDHLALVARQDLLLQQRRDPAAVAVMPLPNSSHQALSPRWNEPPGPASGPIGPIAAFGLVRAFPKPCTVKITVAKDKPNFKSTVGWLLTEISGCEVWGEGPPIEHFGEPEYTKERGVVIHWNGRQ